MCAVGFPLSEVLGNSVKIVSGSIAGFVDLDGVTNLQIDGAVNPGNSGGPLVNHQGHVVGVVNAKLGGESISKIGFAIPVEYVKQMLESRSIDYSAADQDQPLSGPELAAQLTPAVAFVVAKTGKDGFQSTRKFLISASGTVSQTDGPDTRQSRSVIQGDLILDTQGGLVDSNCQVNLPLLIGPVASMPWETLPRVARRKWSRVENLVLPLPDEMPARFRQPTRRTDPFAPFGFGGRLRFQPPGFRSGFGDQLGVPERNDSTKMRTAVAKRTLTYEITGQQDDRVMISSTEIFITEADDDEFSNLRMQTQSKLEFDLKLGGFVAKTMSGEIRFKLGSENHSFPVKFSYRRVNLDDLFADSKPQQKTDLISSPPAGLTEEQLRRFVEFNKNLPEPELLEYLDSLAAWNDVPQLATEITAAIEQVLESAGRTARKPAIDALLNWNPAAATPLVIDEFNNASTFSKRSWIVRLGRTGDERAAQVLCQLLNDSRRRVVAASALTQLGPSAEPGVVTMLENSLDDLTTAGVCLEVLEEIGAESSQSAIQGVLERQPDWPLSWQAEKTLKAIQARNHN